MEGFSQAMKVEEKSGRDRAGASPIWIKPSLGVGKINWDAAISKETDKMGVRVVIRDGNGLVVAARTKVIPYIIDLAAAEAIAAGEAVVLAQDVGGSRILLEGDSLVIVLALGARDSSFRVYGQVLDDIKSLFSYFSLVEVQHIRRNANWVAHVLAKYALSQLLNNTWIAECPSFIQLLVAADYECTT